MNHNDRKVTLAIKELVGPPYPLLERIRMGGNGSTRLDVLTYSECFNEHFGRELDRKFLNIEVRPKGIVVYIKNKVNDFAWVVPYAHLRLDRSEGFCIHGPEGGIALAPTSVFPKNRSLVQRIEQALRDPGSTAGRERTPIP